MPCCDDLAKAVIDHDPVKMESHVLGCCGGCYVLKITHCPFCGQRIRFEET